MQLIQDIFAEYIAMRRKGMSANETLNILRSHIELLPKTTKKELAGYIQTFENKQGEKLQDPKRGTSSQKIPAPSAAPPTTPAATPPTATPPAPAVKDDPKTTTSIRAIKPQWIECPNCKKKNRNDVIFCYACGTLLDNLPEKFGTRQFAAADAKEPHYFGKDSLLVLQLRDSDFDYEVRPKLGGEEFIIGRGVQNSAILPDIDLSNANGEQMGVSRLHLAIKYQTDQQAILVYDLGSANGSYINGQKLHPKETRILRDGDEIRLGKLVFRVSFMHPGAEIK